MQLASLFNHPGWDCSTSCANYTRQDCCGKGGKPEYWDRCGSTRRLGGMTHAQIKGINRCRCGNSERYADMADVSKEHEIWCVCMHAQVHPNPLFASTFAGMIICKHQVPFPPAALRRRDLLRHSRLPWESFEAAVATLADDPPATARAFLDFLRVVFVSLTFVGFLFLAPGVLKTSPPIFLNSNSSLKPTRRLHSPTGAKPSVNM